MHVRHLPALTGVRGIAALWVVLWHARAPFYAGTGYSDLAFFEMAWFGVDIFFVLSGFILSHVHFSDFLRPSWRTTGEFIYLRFSRIYPVHLFSLAIVACFFLLTVALGKPLEGRPRFGLDLFIANLLLVQSWGWADNDSWNVLAWSISTEWFMYLVFPAIAIALSRVNSSTGALLGAAAAFLCMAFALTALGTDGTFTTYRFGLIRTSGSFVAGCLIYSAYRSRRLAHLNWAHIELVSTLWLLAAAFYFRSSFGALPAVALLILSLAEGRGVISRLCASRPIFFLGEISYSLYMMHMIVLEICFLPLDYSRLGREAPPALVLAWLAGALVVVALATLWTFRHVEKPARIALRRFAGR